MYTKLVAPYLPELDATCLKTPLACYTATPDFHFVIDRHPRMPNVIIASPCSARVQALARGGRGRWRRWCSTAGAIWTCALLAFDRLGRW